MGKMKTQKITDEKNKKNGSDIKEISYTTKKN